MQVETKGTAHKLDVGKQAVFAQVKEMAEELDAEQFFARLEEMIDQVRRDLELIPEPGFREELREVFKEVITYALSLKLGDVIGEKQKARGLGIRG
jgi:hypothetical protein